MDLSSLFNSLSLSDSNPSNITNFSAKIGDHHTEIVLAGFENENFLIVSQYSKLGSLYKVFIDQPGNDFNISEPVYTLKQIFGTVSIEAEATVRYLAEQLKITKPLSVFLNLKDYTKETVVSVAEAIKNHPGSQ